MAAMVHLAVKQGGRQLKEREDYDLRPDETFDQLIARAIDVPDGAEITARLYPDARHLLALSANVKDLGVPVAPRAVHNPYICAIVTQPAPPPISEEEAEAKRKTNSAHTLSLLQSAVTRMNKLPVKHDTEKKLRAEHLAFNWVVDFLEREGLAFPDLEQNKPSGTGYRFALELSKLLTYIDGHTYKFADASCALPAKFVIEGGFRSVVSFETISRKNCFGLGYVEFHSGCRELYICTHLANMVSECYFGVGSVHIRNLNHLSFHSMTFAPLPLPPQP